jgi:hypothetical protein
MDGVVVGSDAHLVIARQLDRTAPADDRRDGRLGNHRRPIRGDAPAMTLVGLLQPLVQLRVEVCRPGEGAAGTNDVSR